MWDYRAQLVRVTDGDTVRFNLDHGMSIRSVQAIRLAGVDAPEMDTPAGKAARLWVVDWFASHDHDDLNEWPFRVTTVKDRRTFNRYIGVVRCDVCGAVLNDDVNAYLVTVAGLE